MLKLIGITKEYASGDEITTALKGIDLELPEKGFVSVLGQSGCGKTTLLNIIGGLDKSTSGKLLIDNKSTEEFKDPDWDAYRNTRVGFVFQSYNLISHLTALDNVTMALALSGITGKERNQKAKEALESVGLEKQAYKKPGQMSGGQTQKVAIARALVNDPDIVLADEPTGALDSQTSLQVMEILKEISKDRLVVMVTHNGELAEEYSDRIIRMKDGGIISDSGGNESSGSGCVPEVSDKLDIKGTKMSLKEALKSSYKNLLTKKWRTIITILAGSIGIIGVALVLSISSGMDTFINDMERDTLAAFPIEVRQNVQTDQITDGSPQEFLESDGDFPGDDIFHPYDKSGEVTDHENDIDGQYVDYVEKMDDSYYNSILYSYGLSKNILTETSEGKYKLVDTAGGSDDIMDPTALLGAEEVFSELPGEEKFVQAQYDVLAGKYPSGYDELALVVDKDNRIDDALLDAFGIEEKDEYDPNDLIGKEFKVILNDDFYQKFGDYYVGGNDYEKMYESGESLSIKITAIMRVKENASAEMLEPGIFYTHGLTEKIFDGNEDSEVVEAQRYNKDTSVLTGEGFNSENTYGSTMRFLGGDSTPTKISIYPKTYEDKADIRSYLDDYNDGKEENDQIIYSDLSETMSDAISSMVDTVSVILVAFAGISLVVSSVMIGIITYVSVVERTKEIGIMRAIGARKKDISRIFNAETILIGAGSGIIGVLLNSLLCIPASKLISGMIGMEFTVSLAAQNVILLVLLSIALTLIAGIIPSRIAAGKDPVVALRTE